MAQRVRVVAGVFEDLVASGLARLLEDDPSVELVASDISLEGLDAAMAEHEPAVALLNLGALPSASVIYELRGSHPETHIVVLANRPSSAEATQMLSFGAAACIPKEAQARDIVTAIHLASRGMNMLPRAANGLAPVGPDLLTAREADVLQLLQESRTNAEIAHALSIGIETVRTHARNIYRKLGVSSRRDLLGPARPETSERG